MANERTLPGFDNILAEQSGEHFLVLRAEHDYSGTVKTFDRREYDSDQEFMMECIQWARRNGGIEVPS